MAGTNGKGSVSAFLESVLRAAGRRTGLFTSPHLIRFNERIRVCGDAIPDESISAGLEALRMLTDGWDPHPTFFELTFALALDWFERAGATWIVLETGMGGRLDSTNCITPVVSIITPVAMDHEQWLGNTLSQIATEKAGIIKPGVPVVSAAQHPETAAVLREAAEAANSSLVFVDDPCVYLPADIPLPLAGAHQRHNAALAVAALQAAGIFLPSEIIREGLAATRWPGRFELLENGRIILDGAHNPHGAETLVRTWHETFPGEKARLIFGAVTPRDYRQSLEILAPIAAEAAFVTVRSPRAIPADELAAAWNRLVPGAPAFEATLPEALMKPTPYRSLVCGSLFLCGETLALTSSASFQPSSQ